MLRVKWYSINNLADILANCFNPPVATIKKVKAKNHLDYFHDYFANKNTKARTIVIEAPYTDRDFLEDYAAYYVRCLDKYRSRCCRLHFFSKQFTQKELENLIRGDRGRLTKNNFRKAYLGFFVVRPLPETFIGRTCLKTYAREGHRHYPVVRDYPVHLGGFTLHVRSLAFQEQDHAASACATSALWSAFHGTGILFHHGIPSPIEITRHATARVAGIARSLPNSGLSLPQMAAAVTEIGLEPETLEMSEVDQTFFQGVHYAYLRAGIPLLLLVRMVDAANPDDVRPYPDVFEDLHAVTVTGFSLGSKDLKQYPGYDPLFTHTKIDKLYVHDDQVGPFARVVLVGPVSHRGKRLSDFSLTTSWPDQHDKRGNIRFLPERVIIPLYHKIRIPYRSVFARVADNDNVFRIFGLVLEWDVFLTFAWAVRESVRKSIKTLDADYRWGLIEKPLPRFIWRATGVFKRRPVVDFLYDATDVETADYSLGSIWHNPSVRSQLKGKLPDGEYRDLTQSG